MNFLEDLLSSLHFSPFEPIVPTVLPVSPSFSIPISPPKIQVSSSKPRHRKGGKSMYNWNKIEQRKYINFLIKNRELFDLSNQEKKCIKINRIMAKAIGSRSAAQCHTHHQKMTQKYGSIEATIGVHTHLITKRAVPKHMQGFINSLLNPNQSPTNTGLDQGASIQMNEIYSQPIWKEYMGLWEDNQHNFPKEMDLDKLQFL